MSNFLSIATVTETLRLLLSSAITPVLGGATVSTGRPAAATAGDRTPRVSIFLYQVHPNGHWRNQDLPTRNAEGRLVQRPRVALDLHYLITCFGEDVTQDDQQLLGLVTRTLHSSPSLTADLINSAVAAATNNWLAASDLAQELELARFTPLPLTLEELSKLWSVFFQTQYELSVAYSCGPVFIEPDDVPLSVLPVLERNVYVVTARRPTIDQVQSSAGLNQPVVLGTDLLVIGRDLLGAVPTATTVLINGASTPFIAATATDLQLRVPLPAGLAVGSHLVQVQQPMEMGRPPVPHAGPESNLAAFVLEPQIAGAVTVANVQGGGANPRSADITLTVQPPLVAGQQANLSLISLVDGTTLSFPVGIGPNPLTVSVTGVPPGAYYVRIRLNRVLSSLVQDINPASPTFGLWAGPRVTLR